VKGTTEYYMFARRVQWNRPGVAAGAHLAELNVLLDRLRLGHLDVRLPSASELMLTIKRLQPGVISVEDALATARI
jgi:hypothetical protein